jgi:hypothetical protein
MATIRQLRLWGRGLRTTRILKIVRSTFKCVVSKPWAICFRIKVKLLTVWSGPKKESPKVITFEPSIWRASKKCTIHLLPITATAILAALNIATYFIGAEYQGPTTTIGQGFDNLALQITAKLYVSLLAFWTLLVTYKSRLGTSHHCFIVDCAYGCPKTRASTRLYRFAFWHPNSEYAIC